MYPILFLSTGSSCPLFPLFFHSSPGNLGKKRGDYVRMSYHLGGPVRYSPPSNSLKPAKECFPSVIDVLCLSECELCHTKRQNDGIRCNVKVWLFPGKIHGLPCSSCLLFHWEAWRLQRCGCFLFRSSLTVGLWPMQILIFHLLSSMPF